MRACDVYTQMDGSVTTRYYKQIETRGPAGVLAMNLFRAQKCSARAKVYKQKKYTQAAYERKQWSVGELCGVLRRHGDALGIRYGWKEDPKTLLWGEISWVIYVELPTGQISFHCPRRGNGPDYERNWDQTRASMERILAFCDMVFDREFPTTLEGLACEDQGQLPL